MQVMGGVKQGKMKLQEIQACLKNANLANNSVGLEFPELQQILSGPPKPAAVLLPLLWVEDGWNLLFTRRTTGLQEHSGQVAFPGGRMDPDDCCVEETALREAQEEIGLAPKDVQLLGRLKETLTISNYLVTPLVGAIPWPYPLRPLPAGGQPHVHHPARLAGRTKPSRNPPPQPTRSCQTHPSRLLSAL